MSDEPTSAALLEQLVYIDNYINGNASTATDSSTATPNLDMDGQLSLDLAAFADDSFIFPDEDKKHNNDNSNSDSNWNIQEFDNQEIGSSHSHSHSQSHNHHHHHHNHVEDLNNNNILRQQEFQSHLPSLTHQPHHLLTSLLASQSHAHLTTQEPATIDLMNPSSFVNLTDLPKFPVPPGAKSSLFDAGLSQNQIDLLSALVAQHQASLGNPIPSVQSPNATATTTTTPLSVSPAELPLRINNSITTVAPITTTNVNVNANGHLHQSLVSLQLSNTTMALLDPIPSSSSVSPSSVTGGNTQGFAAELDKKRRNTAASARFRFKKKLREKQMETKINNLEDLIVNLENQLNNLEMENKLLRNLIIEKGTQKSDDEVKLLREKARLNQ